MKSRIYRMREDVGMFGPEQMSSPSLNDLFEQTENNISPTNVVILKKTIFSPGSGTTG